MSTAELGHLYAALPAAREAECFDLLHEIEGVRIERIVSHGQASAPGAWYDQGDAEWVVVLRGSATILFEGDASAVRLGPGDHVLIAPHRRHRVEWTDPSQQTVWLAVHVPCQSSRPITRSSE